MPLDDENFDSQYLIAFKYDYYNELIIDYELVEFVNNKEQELIKSDYVNKEMNIKNSRSSSRDDQLQKIIGNTNTYKRVKGRESSHE
ncbi:hypothetical protein F8M41_008374 [Gigaspora margarita]|uniref:Uncharacterized protein n=1 Tax=Gigaspora margarita TaxID=4874 RepID=A0A8H4AVP3_GIGMA|nr:hypothetical protein F8M41_008374 [Gigaspora margarita]